MTNAAGIALFLALITVLALELVGIARAKSGHTDTISEFYWLVVASVPRPARWALNVALVAALVWTAAHLTRII